MSADEQEIRNSLKWTGASADSVLDKQIIEWTKEPQKQCDAKGAQHAWGCSPLFRPLLQRSLVGVLAASSPPRC